MKIPKKDVGPTQVKVKLENTLDDSSLELRDLGFKWSKQMQNILNDSFPVGWSAQSVRDSGNLSKTEGC